MPGSALSHLDEALVALCDGDHAEDLAAIERALGGTTALTAIAEAIRFATAEIRQARQLLVGSNVKPAPFFLNEKTVGDLIAVSEGFEPAGKLVDRPRRSEYPRLAKANDDTPDEGIESPMVEPAPEPVPSPDLGDAPIPDEFGMPDHLSQAAQMVAPDPEDEDAQRAVERAYSGDHDSARSTIRPVRVAVHKGETPRIEIIEAAAQKLREAVAPDLATAGKPVHSAPIRVTGGAPAQFRYKPVQRASEKRAAGITPRREAKALPPLPFEQRRARLQAAETFLKQRGILVTVIDRIAQIRTYRVTGEKSPLLAEQVIEMAIAKGMAA